MSEFNRRVLIIIPAADKATANQAALNFDPVGGLGTFGVPLSANGQEPASHFWASVQMREHVFQGVQQLMAVQFPNAVLVEYDLDSEPDRPAQVLSELGLQTISNGLI